MVNYNDIKKKYLYDNTTNPSDNIKDVELRFYQEALSVTTGNVKDLELRWLTDEGATIKSIEDAWMQVLTAAGYVKGNNQDDRKDYYENE